MVGGSLEVGAASSERFSAGELWNGPDILSCNLTIRSDFSATLFVNGTPVSSTKRSTWPASSRSRLARFQALRGAAVHPPVWRSRGLGPGGQQSEGCVDDGVVFAAELGGQVGLHGRPASVSSGLGGCLGLHQHAGHLRGPKSERIGLANVFSVAEDMGPALGVQSSSEDVIRRVAVVHERAGIAGQDPDVGEGFAATFGVHGDQGQQVGGLIRWPSCLSDHSLRATSCRTPIRSP